MLLSITILGFIVTLLLLINLRQSNKANIYLFFFLLINNIYSLSHYATVYSGNKYFIAVMLVHFAPLYLLIGPLFYFYVRGLIKDDYRLTKVDLMHFIPALLILINAFPFIFKGVAYKLDYAQSIIQDPINILKIKNLYLSPVFTFMLRPIFASGYVIATVTGSFTAFINGTYTVYTGGTNGQGTNLTVTTSTASSSMFGWNFVSEGDASTYIVKDMTNKRIYRITLMIGGGYYSNLITIERLL